MAVFFGHTPLTENDGHTVFTAFQQHFEKKMGLREFDREKKKKKHTGCQVAVARRSH